MVTKTTGKQRRMVILSVHLKSRVYKELQLWKRLPVKKILSIISDEGNAI